MLLRKNRGELEKHIHPHARMSRLQRPSLHVVVQARSLRAILHAGVRVACCVFGVGKLAFGTGGRMGGGRSGRGGWRAGWGAGRVGASQVGRLGGARVGWYGPVGRNVYTARKGVRACGVKNALQTA